MCGKMLSILYMYNLVLIQTKRLVNKSKGRTGRPKRMNFRKSSKGGGGSFPIQKFILQILDLQTGLFEHEIDTKGSFQGMFFNNCIEKNQNKTHFKEGTSEPPPPHPLEMFRKFIRFGDAIRP